MALEQKMRSLYCGLPAGLDFVSAGGVNIIPLNHVPFELQLIVVRWIDALSKAKIEVTENSIVRNDSEYGLSLTEVGWNEFVTWMLQTLEAEQSRLAVESSL